VYSRIERLHETQLTVLAYLEISDKDAREVGHITMSNFPHYLNTIFRHLGISSKLSLEEQRKVASAMYSINMWKTRPDEETSDLIVRALYQPMSSPNSPESELPPMEPPAQNPAEHSVTELDVSELEKVARRFFALTPSQRKVAELIADELDNSAISIHTGMSTESVSTAVSKLYSIAQMPMPVEQLSKPQADEFKRINFGRAFRLFSMMEKTWETNQSPAEAITPPPVKSKHEPHCLPETDLESVSAGLKTLSQRQIQVIRLAASGLDPDAIATKLNRSSKDVGNDFYKSYMKLGLVELKKSRPELEKLSYRSMAVDAFLWLQAQSAEKPIEVETPVIVPPEPKAKEISDRKPVPEQEIRIEHTHKDSDILVGTTGMTLQDPVSVRGVILLSSDAARFIEQQEQYFRLGYRIESISTVSTGTLVKSERLSVLMVKRSL
jgi:DNA-binding NarL/FixJ family response regulator